MGNKVTTDPQRRNNNPDDPLGQSIILDDACVFNGAAGPDQAAGLIPNNGEYAWAGTTGQCAVCSNCAPKRMESSNGKCDSSGHCGWAGTIPMYKRIGYTAPIVDCCLNGVKTVGNKTCDPKYSSGYLTDACNTTYLDYCKGDKIFTDEKCKSWVNRIGSGADLVLNNSCVGDKLHNNSLCTNWCKRNPVQCSTNFKDYCVSPSHFTPGSYCRTQSLVPGFEIDAAVSTYCADHRDDEFCSCINATRQQLSDENAKKDPTLLAILSRPECYITKCASGLGYQTANMRNNLKGGSCPSVNVCQNTLNSLGNTSTELKNISQSCTQSQEGSKTSTGSPTASKPTDNNTFTYILILFFLIAIGVVGYINTAKNNPQAGMMNIRSVL